MGGSRNGLAWVKLVRKSYLISLSKAGGVLPRRQDIPPDAFITVEELRRLTPKDEYGQAHTRVGVGYTRPPGLISKNTYLPIIVISFCWLTAKHPDPEGKQLKVVAERLENHLAQDTEVGVFWDWASLYQKDPALFDEAETPAAKPMVEIPFYGGEAYEKRRSPEQIKAFRNALHNMDLWYSHEWTTVWTLRKLPEGCTTRKASYEDSGWTTYEWASAELVKQVDRVVDVYRDEGRTEEHDTRRWPIGPDDFEVLIKEKIFTNGADAAVVAALYRKMSSTQLRSTKKLNFYGMRMGTVSDAQRLGRCLNLCRRLVILDLTATGLRPDKCKELFSAMSAEAHVKIVILDGAVYADGPSRRKESGRATYSSMLTNGGSDVSGIVELANWMKRARCLKKLSMRGTGLHVHCLEALSKGVAQCKTLKHLDLRNNELAGGGRAERPYRKGDPSGIKQLAEAMKQSRSLKEINLKGTDLGRESVEALCELIKGSKSLVRLRLPFSASDRDIVPRVERGSRFWDDDTPDHMIPSVLVAAAYARQNPDLFDASTGSGWDAKDPDLRLHLL